MDPQELNELLAYTTAAADLAAGASLLHAVASDRGWLRGELTPRLRDDLLEALTRLEDAGGRFPRRRVSPRPAADLDDGIAALRAALASSTELDGAPVDLATKAMAVVTALRVHTPRQVGLEAIKPEPGVDVQGLPLPRSGVTLLYSAPARVLLVLVAVPSADGRWLTQELFLRSVDETRYRRVQLPAELVLDELAVCAAEPAAYLHAS